VTAPAVPGAGVLDEPAGAWLDRHAAALLGTYGRPARVLVRGQGAWVWDADGRRYLDLLAGLATTLLGHAHPVLVSAVSGQLATLGHVSNLFAHPLQVALAERLLAVTGAGDGGRVFLCNSGAEANEAAFKIARRTGRPRIVAAVGGFHGRTMGALALTHKPQYREPFAPLPAGVEHVPFGDADAVADALRRGGGQVAAVVLEPIQGEGGVHPAPPGYLAAVRRLTREHGALLVLDEVQSGMGRTGYWLAHHAPHHLGEAAAGDPSSRPDVVTLAKGLGGGVPIGAAVTSSAEVSALLGPGQHGTTFGGNPLACAAALATLHVIEADSLRARAREAGRRLAAGVTGTGHARVRGVRGEGLLRAVELDGPLAPAAAAVALDAGYVVNAVAPDALRLAPPLVVTDDQVDAFVADLPAVLDAAEARAEGRGTAGPGTAGSPPGRPRGRDVPEEDA
jgi:acetylornithine aminotransferase